jgi:hypothetical protein
MASLYFVSLEEGDVSALEGAGGWPGTCWSLAFPEGLLPLLAQDCYNWGDDPPQRIKQGFDDRRHKIIDMKYGYTVCKRSIYRKEHG